MCGSRPKLKKKQSQSQRSKAEERFRSLFDNFSSPQDNPQEEYQFHPVRRWRFDFAWPERLIALEIEGWGRHQRFVGYRNDCEKYLEAALLGWTVLRLTTQQVTPETVVRIARFIEAFPPTAGGAAGRQ